MTVAGSGEDSAEGESAAPAPFDPKTCKYCLELGPAVFERCDGNGRCMGGLGGFEVAGVKPFGWWPIKTSRRAAAG